MKINYTKRIRINKFLLLFYCFYKLVFKLVFIVVLQSELLEISGAQQSMEREVEDLKQQLRRLAMARKKQTKKDAVAQTLTPKNGGLVPSVERCVLKIKLI